MLERTKAGISVAALRERVDDGSSERTIFRDIEQLQAAGFRLEKAEAGWRAVDATEAGFSIPFRASEVMALLLSEDVLGALQSTELYDDLATIRERASALLHPEGLEYVKELRSRLVATFTAPPVERKIEIRDIERAMREEQQIRIAYGRHGEDAVERVVDPHTLWFADGRLYLIGWCHLRDDFRTFLVDRIQSVELLDAEFEPRESFDSRSYVKAGFGGWSEAPQRVRLEFSPAVAHLPRERELHPSQELKDLGDGKIMVTMRVGGLPRIASWVAGFGGLVTVLAPRALHDMVKKIHADGLAAHDFDRADENEARPRRRRDRAQGEED